MRSIRTRLLVAVLPVVALALLSTWLVATTTARTGLHALSDANLDLAAQGLADAVTQMLADARADALTSARLDLAAEAIDTDDGKNFAWYADELVYGKQKYAAVLVTDINGRVVAANTVDAAGQPLKTPLGRSFADDPVFRLGNQNVEPGKIVAFDASHYLDDHKLTQLGVVGFIVPIFDILEEHIGSLVLFCSLDFFGQRLAQSFVTNQGDIDAVALIVNRDGLPVVWPRSLQDAQAFHADDGSTWRGPNNARFRAARHAVGGVGETFGWAVVTLKTAQALDAPVAAITNRIFVGSIVALVTALVVLVVVTTRLVAPLRRLTSAVTTTDRASQFAALPIGAHDETGALTESINRMMATIRSHEENLEQKVAERTAQLAAAKQELTDILDNMEQGIFTIGATGAINAQYSAACQRIFGVDISQRDVFELLQFAETWNQGDTRMRFWLTNIIGADELQWMLAAQDPLPSVRYRPPDAEVANVFVSLQYVPIFKGGVVDKLMIIATDVTRLHDLEAEVKVRDQENRLTVERISEIVGIDPALFVTFIDEARHLVDAALRAATVSDQNAVREIFRSMHTLKGNARIFRMTTLHNVAHAVEDELDVLRSASAETIDLAGVRDRLHEVAALIGEFERLSRRVLGTQAAGATVEARVSTIKVQEAHVIAVRRAFKALRDKLRGERDGLVDELGHSIDMLGRIPFAATLQRYRREVIDIAREMNKTMNDLVVSGDAVEIDARLSDKLGVILMHVLRNAVDHGIEPTEERVASNKAVAGTIRVSCMVDDATLQLVVRDDGRGIDFARVREVAYARQLLREDELDAGDSRRLTELLFQPGFSTARVITSISGRGVGLDVVRTAVTDLGGWVDMESQTGQGTTVRVVIPLTDHQVTTA